MKSIRPRGFSCILLLLVIADGGITLCELANSPLPSQSYPSAYNRFPVKSSGHLKDYPGTIRGFSGVLTKPTYHKQGK
ncbi:hypothetical protein F4806DRAFT_136743 [Annulohypoxylon nitens]|nr:hypothetical protein F4806DRAFT_136743 [Annulohypoxylon nitens]